MKPLEVAKKIERIFPTSLSAKYCEKFDAYDNVGLLVDTGENVEHAVFALDLTAEALLFAKKKNARMIVTHHPVIYHPIKSLDFYETKNLSGALKAGISLYSMHLNCDIAKGGIDERLSLLLTGNKGRVLEEVERDVGYGRVSEIEKTTLKEFYERTKKTFESERILFYGDEKNTLKRVGSFCGSGSSTAIKYADMFDVAVTSDIPHHLIAALTEMGKSIIVIPHWTAENKPFKEIYNEYFASGKLGVTSEYYEDIKFL